MCFVSFLVNVRRDREARVYRSGPTASGRMRDSPRALGIGTRRLLRDRPHLRGHGLRVRADRGPRRARPGPRRARRAAVPARPAARRLGARRGRGRPRLDRGAHTWCRPSGGPAGSRTGSVSSSTGSATRCSPGRRPGCCSTCAWVRRAAARRSNAKACRGFCPSPGEPRLSSSPARRSSSAGSGRSARVSPGGCRFAGARCHGSLARLFAGDLAFRPGRERRDARGPRILSDPRRGGARSFGRADGRRRPGRVRPHAPRPGVHGGGRAGLAAYGIYMVGSALAESSALSVGRATAEACGSTFSAEGGSRFDRTTTVYPVSRSISSVAFTPERAARGAPPSRQLRRRPRRLRSGRRSGAIRVEPRGPGRREELAAPHREVEAQEVLGRRIAAAGGAAAAGQRVDVACAARKAASRSRPRRCSPWRGWARRRPGDSCPSLHPGRDVDVLADVVVVALPRQLFDDEPEDDVARRSSSGGWFPARRAADPSRRAGSSPRASGFAPWASRRTSPRRNPRGPTSSTRAAGS